MKKQLLCLFGIAMALGMSAQTPTPVWGNLIDGPTTAGDQASDISLDNKGNVYWFGNYGSTETESDIYYAGSVLYTGALYNAGNSQNNNYTLLKTDAHGNKLWCVYSNSGDFANNAGFCATTSDGGVITVSKVRHTDGMTDKNICFYNADGTPFEIDWTCDKRFYKIIVTKISADGYIEWNRMIDFSTEPGPAASGNYASFWPDVFNVFGGTVDDNDNIYIALNYRNPVTIARAQGDPAVFTPSNNKSWNGDAQGTCGDFMILGLDNNGFYRNNLQLSGTCAASYCQKLEWADGSLYCQGYIVGENDANLKAGDFTLSPSSIMSPIVLATDTNLNVQWAKCFRGEKVDGKNALQNVDINVINGSVYLCGQYNLKFSDPDNSDNFVKSTQGTIREGFIVKLDAATGTWEVARNSRDDNWDKPSAIAKTGLTGYFKVLPSTTDTESIYVFGYVMNNTVGVFLRRYDASTLEAKLPEGQYNIVTGGGVPSCQNATLDYNTGALYITARGNAAFSLSDGTKTDAPIKWGILAARYDLGKSQVSISDKFIDNSDAPVEYYNLQGIRIGNPTSGLYIRRQGSSVIKVIL